ncbi:MAG: response regulator, partial [Tunicatimonas sp.]
LLAERANHRVQLAEQVLCFYSAVDGLDYLSGLADQQQEAPEVIFLDICMPIVNGWQFLAQFNNFGWSDTAVYMLASSTDQEHINRAKKVASVADYIVKPLTVERLLTIKNDLVGQTVGISPSVT